jgi:hypothetical protein
MDIFSNLTKDALRDLAYSQKLYRRKMELKDIEDTFRNLKSYQSDLTRRLKANKVPEKNVALVKKLLLDVDRCLRIPADEAKLQEIEDYIDRVKKYLK